MEERIPQDLVSKIGDISKREKRLHRRMAGFVIYCLEGHLLHISSGYAEERARLLSSDYEEQATATESAAELFLEATILSIMEGIDNNDEELHRAIELFGEAITTAKKPLGPYYVHSVYINRRGIAGLEGRFDALHGVVSDFYKIIIKGKAG